MYACMYACMRVCMYVCMYRYLYSLTSVPLPEQDAQTSRLDKNKKRHTCGPTGREIVSWVEMPLPRSVLRMTFHFLSTLWVGQ